MGTQALFCTDAQSVTLHPNGMNSMPGESRTFKIPRLLQATVVLIIAALASFLVALCIVAFQNRRQTPEVQAFQQVSQEGNSTGEDNIQFGRVDLAELQESIQKLQGQMENYGTWNKKLQELTCRVDNVSSQTQALSSSLENASAEVQTVKGYLRDTNTLNFQTQMLKSSLEGTNIEIQKLKGDLEKANTLNAQTQLFFQSSSENTSIELHVLGRGLNNANTEIQGLKAGLEMANIQAQLANSSLANATAWIHVLKGNLDVVNVLRAQNQEFRRHMEGASADLQKVEAKLQNIIDLNSKTQNSMKNSSANTRAELQLLRGHLESTADVSRLLKRELENVSAQVHRTTSHLEQAEAQIQVLQTKLQATNALTSQMQELNGHLRTANGEIQTLKQEMKKAEAYSAKTQVLEDNMKKAQAEIKGLKKNSEEIKSLTRKIQEMQRNLAALQTSVSSQQQLQRTQNQVLQLLLQDWKGFNGNLYYFSHNKKTWQDAEKFCVSQGAHLASVTSQEEQAFLIRFTENSVYWIGLTDQGTEGRWRWTDGSSFSSAQSKQFWAVSQPDNWKDGKGGSEDCVTMQQDWNDFYCGEPYQWVCKKSVGAALPSPS